MANEVAVDNKVENETEVEVSETEATEVEAEAKPKRERKQYNVSPEDFVKVWQSSESADEVAQKLNMPKNIVLARSAVYRKNRKDGSPGVPLKKMPRVNPRRLDVENLRKLATETAPAETVTAKAE